jgi:hypothetical protein
MNLVHLHTTQRMARRVRGIKHSIPQQSAAAHNWYTSFNL